MTRLLLETLNILVILSILVHKPSALLFKVAPTAEKCLKDEAQKDELITGSYFIDLVEFTQVSIKIRDSKGMILFQTTEAESGKFSFSLDRRDYVNICFKSEFRPNTHPTHKQKFKHDFQMVELNVKKGEDKDWDAEAALQGLSKLEVEIRKVDDLRVVLRATRSVLLKEKFS